MDLLPEYLPEMPESAAASGHHRYAFPKAYQEICAIRDCLPSDASQPFAERVSAMQSDDIDYQTLALIQFASRFAPLFGMCLLYRCLSGQSSLRMDTAVIAASAADGPGGAALGIRTHVRGFALRIQKIDRRRFTVSVDSAAYGVFSSCCFWNWRV